MSPTADDDLDRRLAFAVGIAREAGDAGLRHFRNLEALTIESKGHQDMVSEADRELELLIRRAIAESYPDDGVVGEEYPPLAGSSGYVWVLDPIDGTANFVAGIPAWCVSIACARDGGAVVGVIHEPSAGETFHARAGGGAFLNGRPIHTSKSDSLGKGSFGVGFSTRSETGQVSGFIARLLESGGVFYRNASGALMLAYVAAGRLIGYAEPHMNAWDCLAGFVLVKEAGGRIIEPDPATVLSAGTITFAAGSGVFDEAKALVDACFTR